MRLLLIGDVHLYRFTWNPFHLLSKRLLGLLNLWFNRRKAFRLIGAADLVERADNVGADVVLCTGDLTTTALQSEFEAVAELLEPLFTHRPGFIVPGNHDRYTFSSKRRRHLEEHLAGRVPQAWPLSHALAEGLHLVGLDAARPLPSWRASGLVPEDQLARLKEVLHELPEGDRVVVMCHYPPGTPPGIREEGHHHRMQNSEAVVEVLREAGRPTLYLHGHVHQPWCWRMETAPNVVAVNAGAPLMISPGYPHGQGFWTIDTEGGWRMQHHAQDAAENWHQVELVPPDEPGTAVELKRPADTRAEAEAPD